jgi:hypothetical protein
MNNNDGYNYLIAHYLFQVDSYDISENNHRLRLKTIGNRNTHNVNIFTLANDDWLQSNIDPRDLPEIGYRIYLASQYQSMKSHSKNTWAKMQSIFYGVHEYIKLYFSHTFRNKRTNRSYAYELVNEDYVDQDVQLTLQVKTTALSINVIMSDLLKDLVLISQIDPKHLITLGYNMAENQINETFWK